MKNLGLWGYIDSTITSLVSLSLRENESTVALKPLKETQDMIDFKVKENVHILDKLGQIYNKTT